MLNLIFSRVYFETFKYRNYGELSNVRKFEIYSERKIIGKLTYNYSVSFFTFLDYSFRIDSKNTFLKLKRDTINLSSNNICGQIVAPNAKGIFAFSDGKLMIEKNVFKMQKKSEQKISIFRKENNVDMELYNNVSNIRYNFKIPRVGVYNNWEGKIESNSNDLFLILSGLYFTELTLDRWFDL